MKPIPTERQIQALYSERWRAIKADPSLLDLLLEADFEAGTLRWRERPSAMFLPGNTSQEGMARTWNKQFAGKPALTALNKGYRCGRICDHMFQAHRVIFAMYHGHWPAEQIDHIDGDPSNNRIANLRAVSALENGRNVRAKRSTTSGTNGVFWSHGRQRWMAQIKVAGRSIHLGSFREKSDAEVSRREAEHRHGFHKNHGAPR